MNIEVGKYYRMRCGGAVMMDEDLFRWDYHNDGKFKGGIAVADPFDLVAEITEAEYNRIVNGEPAGNTEQLLAQQATLLHSELESLKVKNEQLQAEIEALKYDNEAHLETLKLITDNRRFEAALHRKVDDNDISTKGAELLMGYPPPNDIPSNMLYWIEAKERMAVMHADALLKALEETK